MPLWLYVVQSKLIQLLEVVVLLRWEVEIVFLESHRYLFIGQMELSRALREYSRSISGKQQLLINAYAKALECIPKALASNSGLDQSDILNKLRQKHHEGKRKFWTDFIFVVYCKFHFFLYFFLFLLWTSWESMVWSELHWWVNLRYFWTIYMGACLSKVACNSSCYRSTNNSRIVE